jgi:hypothetical protein
MDVATMPELPMVWIDQQLTKLVVSVLSTRKQ